MGASPRRIASTNINNTTKKNTMKKSLVILFTLIANVTFSQITNNSFFIEGNFSYTYQKQGSDHSTQSFNILPRAAYAFGKRFMVSLGVGYKWIQNYNDHADGDKVTNGPVFPVEGYFRYHKEIAPKVYLFSQFFVNFDQCTSNVERNDFNSNIITYDLITSHVNLGLTPGLIYFFNDRIAAELQIGSIGYQWAKYNQKNTDGSGGQSAYTESKVDISFVDMALWLGIMIKLNNN
jgi:hypothetical protein